MNGVGCRAPDRDAILDSLLHKYQALLALREERAEAEQRGWIRFPEGERPARKARFRVLAEAFPGALRELDTSSVERLQGRLTELFDHARTPSRPLPLWMVVSFDYHRITRALLRIKGWLPRGSIPPRAFAAFERLMARHHPVPTIDWASALVRVHRPPNGRLQVLVWEILESRHGLDRNELEALIFGP